MDMVLLAAAGAKSQYWPLAILPAMATLFFWSRAGSSLIQGIQKVDAIIVAIFRRIAWIPGAMWQPQPKWAKVLKYLWFFLFFGLTIGGAFLLHFGIVEVGSDSLDARIVIALIAIGYLAALAVGRSWVSVESKLLDEVETSDAWRLSSSLRPLAVFSLTALLFVIPLSFQVSDPHTSPPSSATELGLGQATVSESQGKNQAANYGDWVGHTVNLLFLAAIDFGDVVPWIRTDLKANQYVSFLNFLTLAYVFVTGITLLARGDHAMRVDLERLREKGEIGNIARFGERGMRKLIELLENPQGVPLKGQVGAVIGLGEIKENSGIGNHKGFSLLLELLSRKDSPYEVRCEAANSLGKWGSPRALPSLFTALEFDSRPSVQMAAAMAIRKIDQLSRDQIAELIRITRAKCDPENPQENIGVRRLVAYSFFALPHMMDHASIRVMLSEWRSWDGDQELKDKLQSALDLHGKNRRSNAISQGIDDLSSDDPEKRKSAAVRLTPFISEWKVVRALVSSASQDENLDARLRAVKALHKEQSGNSRIDDYIVSCLRTRLREDKSAQVRSNSASGLKKFRPPAGYTIQVLAKSMETDGNLAVRKECIKSLARLGAQTELETYVQSCAVAKRKAHPQAAESSVDQELVDFITQILRDLFRGELGNDRDDDSDNNMGLS